MSIRPKRPNMVLAYSRVPRPRLWAAVSSRAGEHGGVARPSGLAWVLIPLLGIVASATAADDDPAPAAPPPRRTIEQLEAAWPDHPEWLAMLVDIADGSQLGPDDGWFRKAVAQTRLGWDAAKERFDADKDDSVARAEFPGTDADFGRLDRDRDGALTSADFDFSAHALAPSPGMMLFYGADTDGNGKVTREEFAALFDGIASDPDDEFLSLAELQGMFNQPPRRGRGSSGGPEGPSRETLIRGLFNQEIGSLQPGPNVGEPAPDFTLKTVDGDDSLTLANRIGPKPVVLIFGNFTCGPFRSQAGNVEKLYDRYKDRANFAMVYVREAHPTDGWSMESNDRVRVTLAQPTTDDERRQVAQTCRRTLDLDLPMLVDTIDDTVGAAYSGMPSRLYLIDGDGKVAYKSGRGPFGFKPVELEQSLVMLLNEPAPEAAEVPAARVPVVTDEEAWQLLPPAERGDGQPLPTWARALARPMPRTTAAMLDADRLHRTKSPLGERLRGLMRWVAADANESPYGRATAEADLVRAGVPESDLEALRQGKFGSFPEAERRALEFAYQLTMDGAAVSDEQVARLVALHGDSDVVAMVLLMAYANFQDRLLLTLGIELEPGGPLPPVDVAFLKPLSPMPVPDRTKPENGPVPPDSPLLVDDPSWGAIDFDALQTSLTTQRDNPGRVRVPTFEEVLAKLPPGAPQPKNPIRIKWSLVCMGYQPELAAAWSACTSAFGQEARQDRVFEESLFWVVTREIACFY